MPAVLQPITLRQLFSQVTTQPLLEVARARARAARGNRISAGAPGNPLLAYQVDNASVAGSRPVPVERESIATATLPLELLYQRQPRVRRTDAALRAAQADITTTQQHLLLDAARSYYRVGLAQVGVTVAHDLAAWLDTLVDYNRIRAKEGAAAEADLLRSELERDRATADAALQEAELARARSELRVFLDGAEPQPDTLVVATPNAPFMLPPDRSMRLEEAVAVRPELRSARERVLAAAAGVTVERSMIVRQLGVTVGTKNRAGTSSLIAGLSAPIPLFDQNRGDIARASAERDAAAYELAAAERGVRAEVMAAHDAAVILTARAEPLARIDSKGEPEFLSRTDEARRITLGAYREGAVLLIQVLDAARAWGDARMAYFRLMTAQRESVVQLLAALGTDLTSWDMRVSHSIRE